MKKIDLHTHTNASDGNLTPKELIKEAEKKELIAIAITDHDTVDGLDEALSAKSSVEVVPGVEISCDAPKNGFIDFHILGLFVDHKNKAIIDLLEKSKKARIEQKKLIIKRLNELGYDITFNEAMNFAKGEIGRPHIAMALMKNYPDKFKEIKDVFDKVLGNKKPGFVPRKTIITGKETIDAIHKAGGKAILAHPGVYSDEHAKQLIDFFVKEGGDGIETDYSYHMNIIGITKEMEKQKIEFFKKIAKEQNLLESGGSDYHGTSKRVPLGELKISEDILKSLAG